ncbi:MAG: glycoside hydrolase family 52 protein [Faecalibacterium sp.]
MHSQFFQTIHSPIGAAAGFAMGLHNQGGGFLLEPDRIQPEPLWIGYKEGQTVRCFPFFEEGQASGKEAYAQNEAQPAVAVMPFTKEEIKRDFAYATDTFTAPKISFTLMNRICDLPEPGTADLSYELLPGLLARLMVDNTAGTEEMEAMFGVGGIRGKTFLARATENRLMGVLGNAGCGFAVQNSGKYQMQEFGDFDIPSLYAKKQPVPHVLGPMSGILVKVPAGEVAVIEIALGWYLPQVVTSGLFTSKYYYTQYYTSLLDVLDKTFGYSARLWTEAAANDAVLAASGLSEERKFFVAQSVKSYYISSMIFRSEDGEVRWAMNEGSFCMINTFDLTIDHLFFDMQQHPWVVKNQLDVYVQDYSYYDQCGLAFTHDHGVTGLYTEKGYSSYEIPKIVDCFSYMSQEELCNWILAASVYAKQTGDTAWLTANAKVIEDCFTSMCNRDGEEKDGVMDIDSSRCEGGWEITTYDSLDPSLGQARGNTYIAMKCFACYLACMDMFETLYGQGHALVTAAQDQALLCATTLLGYKNADGTFPAIYKEDNNTMIIPAVEGVIYPWAIGKWDWMQQQPVCKELLESLTHHLETVVNSGLCLFPDGGWRLSESSNNSWISKIFLCQFIAEEILGAKVDMPSADSAHAHWWQVGCATNPGIDQIFDGTQSERGFHYPRCVTSILFMPKG